MHITCRHKIRSKLDTTEDDHGYRIRITDLNDESFQACSSPIDIEPPETPEKPKEKREEKTKDKKEGKKEDKTEEKKEGKKGEKTEGEQPDDTPEEDEGLPAPPCTADDDESTHLFGHACDD